MCGSKLRIFVFVAAFGVAAVSTAFATRAADTKTISSVEVQEQDGVTRIILRGAEDPIYTAFMREDPPRLIVELPDVIFSGVKSPIRVENGMVNHVTLGAFGDPRVALSMARVSVGLTRDAEYELLPDGDELVIEIRPMGGDSVALAEDASTPAPAAPAEELAPQATELADENAPDAGELYADDPAESDEPLMDEAQADELMAPEANTEPAVEETAEPATEPAADDTPTGGVSKLLQVVPTEDGIEVMADGPIDNIDSFTLEDPARLVVDFWGVKNAVWPARSNLDHAQVAQVRIGEHADKVRVVFDLVAPIASHGVEPIAGGIRIHMDRDGLVAEADATDMQDEELPAAPDDTSDADNAGDMDMAADDSAEAAVEEPVHWSEPARVESVHFESMPDTDRVVVTLNHPAEAKLVAPDDATIIVMLQDTQIAPDIERRVDTTDFGGPVEHVSVFKTPDVDYEEVRVVLKREGSAVSNLTWQENQLYIELARESADTNWDMPADDMVADQGGDMSGMEPMDMGTEGAAPAPDNGVVPASTGGQHTSASGSDDPFFLEGPADPAAIDMLEEGGFSDEKQYTGRRISLDFKDADIGNILRLIAEVSDLNVIAGEEVEGKVTIRLVDVPWDQALDVILLTKGLGFVRVGNVLRIAPLDTLKLEAEARLQDRRAKEKLEDLVVKLQPVNYANVKEVAQLVKKLLSKRGTVNTDRRTNTLIMKDIPSVVQEATALVKAIDTATPQVLIESKIVEASLSFSRALGATWGLGYNPLGSSGGAPDFHLADGLNPDLIGLASGAQTSNFIAANPIFAANNGFLSLGILGLDDHLQLDLAIEAAESNNKGKVISSPRVVTLDNREAVIKQGVAIKFEAATRDKITISFIDAVLELKVTPHITANRSIIMDLKVSRNAPSISAATGDIVGINKNEAHTNALVRDGETIVLGGIYVVDSGKSVTKTPFLADIPLLGTVFQSRTIQDERRELLIFVTPRIITGTPAAADL
jgi:type IV pilus assembly protein PilQ